MPEGSLADLPPHITTADPRFRFVPPPPPPPRPRSRVISFPRHATPVVLLYHHLHDTTTTAVAAAAAAMPSSRVSIAAVPTYGLLALTAAFLTSLAIREAFLIDTGVQQVLQGTSVLHDLDRAGIPFLCLGLLIALAHLVTPYTAYLLELLHLGYLEPNTPRASRTTLPPDSLAARAWAAHLNHVEGIAMAASAIIIAHARKVDLKIRIALSVTLVTARIVHYAAYLGGSWHLRFMAYKLGLFCVAALFGYALIGSQFHGHVSEFSYAASSLGEQVGDQVVELIRTTSGAAERVREALVAALQS
ncbi:hypothetical protein BC828DRAFT_374680 [Blastocladiella britannica]|nr:hypothetical protein BC828DRAFT_374680 [Blastocladiella britannica]